jgi:glutamate 5-kinase
MSERWVIKVGSGVLAGDDGALRVDRVHAIASQAAALKEMGHQVVIVSSGAVASGFRHLGFDRPPQDLPDRQACASVGQFFLIAAYEEIFAGRGTAAGLVLLTHDDINDRRRYLHARNTIDTLLRRGAVPVINENDAVAVEEILLGDNDQLAAMVAAFIEADRLVLLTNVAGVLSGAPDAPGATVVPEITDAEEFAAGLGDGKSSLGRGGMRGKVLAAGRAASYGIPVRIADGRDPETLLKLARGEACGTLVQPATTPLSARRFWIRFVTRPKGTLHVDAGAVKAIVEQGRSLLPRGIVRVEGVFDAGDAVKIVGPDGTALARGLTSYSHGELGRLAGRHSSEIEGVLGYRRAGEAVHRDDLALETRRFVPTQAQETMP